MPGRPSHPCRHPGCGVLIASSAPYCELHTRQTRRESDQRRGSSTARGYGSKWRAARAVFLRENPLCVACREANLIVPATDVDHIIPHRGDQKLFWSRSNWQALCHPCHARKTAREDGGFSNERRLAGGD
ncbi:HNH endonuclease [Burkholderia gladioli]|uniref:HNH endonuclease n=1 Tax=Burkholderia gladioli TaxID=28095 RepID=UPI001641CF0A|nr:HNH endonuclease [Burkholderia gladioli]